MKKTRMAPPPHLRHVHTKLASGTHDIMRLQAQGWTIVEANGEMNIDAPPDITERIEQVLGDVPKKKRPRIVKEQ